ncbi:MAG: bifunctional riboflavin kinase/FAD synthetase [bacterium]
MKVIEGLSKLRRKFKSSVVALGTFDGVHCGHQQVIRTTKDVARRHGRTSMLVTFQPLPRVVVAGEREKVESITTLKQKEEIIRKLGIDAMLVIHFNRKLAQVEPEEFVRKVIYQKIGAGRVVVGPGFRFGKNRLGNVALLKRLGRKYGFEVTTVGEVKIGDIKASSSKIRQLLWQGKIEMANRLLGRYYTISGTVKKGSGRGKELSFPTANLHISGDVILPQGVYAVLVSIKGKEHTGVANIGTRPTFSPGLQFLPGKVTRKYIRPIVEVYIFNFKGNLYRQKLEIFLIKRIRKEMKFPTPEKLINRVKKDIQFTKKLPPISGCLTKAE